jgi:hypothetical protein
MATSVPPTPGPAAAAAPGPAPAPPDFQKTISDLEVQSKNQDLRDAKLQLAEIKQINADVQQAEAGYKKELETIKWQYARYENSSAPQIDAMVPASEKTVIDGIVKVVGAQIDSLQQQWKAVQPLAAAKQATWSAAQITRQEKEKPYRDALDYKGNLKDLEALLAQSTKAIDAKNFRGAYFLVEIEMAADLKLPRPAVDEYNAALEKLALDFFAAQDAERMTKTDFDQATADLQKKQKAYSDAYNSRRDTILKQIADQQFPQPVAPPAGGAVPVAGGGATPPAGGGTPVTPPSPGSPATPAAGTAPVAGYGSGTPAVQGPAGTTQASGGHS